MKEFLKYYKNDEGDLTPDFKYDHLNKNVFNHIKRTSNHSKTSKLNTFKLD